MLTAIARRAAGPLVIARLRALEAQGTMPVPRDEPRVRIDGADVERVLLLGGVLAGSHGVVSHQFGMAGHLARMVHALTGRGVEIEVASFLPGSVHQLTSELDGIVLQGFDAIVAFVGGIEARSLWSDDRWRHDLGAMLSRLSMLAPSVPVVIVVLTQLPTSTNIPRVMRALVNRSCRRLNAVTKTLVDAIPSYRLVPLSITLPAAGETLHLSYAEAADAIVPALSEVLLTSPPVSSRPPDREAEARRQGALDLLGILDSGSDARYDRIAEHARVLLGASGAAVTFIDHERRYVKAAVGLPTGDISRLLAFCDSTIRSGAGFVVEDIREASEFAGHPWVVGREQVRSYAGYALRSPGGDAVGAVCVVDSVPRSFSELDLSLLRHLAKQLELLLWSGTEAARR